MYRISGVTAWSERVLRHDALHCVDKLCVGEGLTEDLGLFWHDGEGKEGPDEETRMAIIDHRMNMLATIMSGKLAFKSAKPLIQGFRRN
ncbi:MAG: hypothetical protein ACE5Z5_07375 [Candidatus Bathyarchaeia archaeon]